MKLELMPARVPRGGRALVVAPAAAALHQRSLRPAHLFSNILGLLGLLMAMLYLSLHHGWLLDAKVDVVKTVSRITAEAIAYRAVNEHRAPSSIPTACRSSPGASPAR